jgi:hypothetical protein
MDVEKSLLFFVITYWMNVIVILLFSSSIITLLCHSIALVLLWRRKVGGDALYEYAVHIHRVPYSQSIRARNESISSKIFNEHRSTLSMH